MSLRYSHTGSGQSVSRAFTRYEEKNLERLNQLSRRWHPTPGIRWSGPVLLLGVIATAISLRAANPQANRGLDRSEAIAFIVNRANPVDDIKFSQLRDLMLQEQGTWKDGRKVTVVMQEAGQPAREVVLRLVYRMNEKEHDQFLLHSAFTGSSRSDPRTLSDGKGVAKFVSLVPGAIGYLKADDADGSIKVLKIDGVAPGEPGYKLNFAAVTKPTRMSARN